MDLGIFIVKILKFVVCIYHENKNIYFTTDNHCS